MKLAVHRKIVYLIAAAALLLMLVGTAVTASPVLADCTNVGSTACGG